MEFNGFKVTPIGNAELSIENEMLRVSNLSDSGFDGVIINVNDAKGYDIQYPKMTQMSEHNAVLRSTSFMKDEQGQVTAFSETFKRYDKRLDKVLFGFNASYLPKEFNILGRLGKEIVFDINSLDLEIIDTEGDEPQYAPWVVFWHIGKWAWRAFSAAMTLKEVYDMIVSHQTVSVKEMLDDRGNLTGWEVDVVFDPVPFELMINQKKYDIEDLIIRYKMECPEYFKDKNSYKTSLIGEQITACNMPYFEIKSIEKYE